MNLIFIIKIFYHIIKLWIKKMMILLLSILSTYHSKILMKSPPFTSFIKNGEQVLDEATMLMLMSNPNPPANDSTK